MCPIDVEYTADIPEFGAKRSIGSIHPSDRESIGLESSTGERIVFMCNPDDSGGTIYSEEHQARAIQILSIGQGTQITRHVSSRNLREIQSICVGETAQVDMQNQSGIRCTIYATHRPATPPLS